MNIEQLMTREVVVAQPETTLKKVAESLVRHRITGVPVCDALGAVIGVVSEADILYKERNPVERHGLVNWLSGGPLPAEAAKTAALTAGEAMTAPAITIAPGETVEHAARLMMTRGINRLPVLDGARLVGIVTRADLVRAFARTDEEIAHEIREDVIRQTMRVDPALVAVEVDEGAVSLSGQVQTQNDASLIEHFAARVPGVVALVSTVSWLDDNGALRETPVP